MKDTSPEPRGAVDDALGSLGDLEKFSNALRDLADPSRDRDEVWHQHYGGAPTDRDLAALAELAELLGTADVTAATHDIDPLDAMSSATFGAADLSAGD